MREIGKTLMVFGVIVVVAGALIWAGFGNWLGRLPGDMRIDRGNNTLYFPIVTCIVVSVVLTLLLSLFRR